MSQSRQAPFTIELSGARSPEPHKLTLVEALLIAALLHFAAIWLMTRLPVITSRPASLADRLQVEFENPRQPEQPRRQPRPQVKPRPFKFVDIPDEPEVANPNAPSLSDRSRRARAPLRPDAAHKAENPDPYALGNTPQNVLLAPAPKPPPAPVGEQAGSPSKPVPAGEAGGPAPEPGGGAEKSAELGLKQAKVGPGSGQLSGTESAQPPGTGGAQRRSGAPGGLLSQVPRVSEGELLESFHNPGGSTQSQIGSVSFDTAAIDWGPYAREMLRIIRRNWIERYPPAAASGLMGVAIVSFRIARNGGVSSVSLVDSYGVRLSPSGRVEIIPGIRPLETAALEAIQNSELPSLPNIFTEPDVGVSIGFYYNVPPPNR